MDKLKKNLLNFLHKMCDSFYNIKVYKIYKILKKIIVINI